MRWAIYQKQSISLYTVNTFIAQVKTINNYIVHIAAMWVREYIEQVHGACIRIDLAVDFILLYAYRLFVVAAVSKGAENFEHHYWFLCVHDRGFVNVLWWD